MWALSAAVIPLSQGLGQACLLPDLTSSIQLFLGEASSGPSSVAPPLPPGSVKQKLRLFPTPPATTDPGLPLQEFPVTGGVENERGAQRDDLRSSSLIPSPRAGRI